MNKFYFSVESRGKKTNKHQRSLYQIEAELGPIQMRSDIWFWMEKMIDQTYTIFRKVFFNYY